MFKTINRLPGPGWSDVRRRIQESADHVCDQNAYRDLRARLRGDDHEFRSALFELYIHRCLIASGYEVTIHPQVDGRVHRPDFLAERPDGSFYVEAVVPGASASERAADGRRSQFLDVVNSLADDRFWLALEELVPGDQPAAAAKLRTYLATWLEGLDPEACVDPQTCPTTAWSHGGWEATFSAIARPPAARAAFEKDPRAIGVYGGGEAEIVDYPPMIRKALNKKQAEHRGLDAALVLAVGLHLIFDRDRRQRIAALYGDETYEISLKDRKVQRAWRKSDGFFGAPPDWRNHHVSGVLLVNQLDPRTLVPEDAILALHPDPLHRLDLGEAFPCSVIEYRAGKFVELAAGQG